MLKLMSHDTPSIVADNRVAQVMKASPEYLGQNRESVLHILRKEDSLCKGYGKTLESVLLTLHKCISLRKGKTTLFPISPS